MRDSYSLYEAKARLSALVKQVREGHRIVITVHGEPAAELCPVEPASRGITARVAHLTSRGIIAPTTRPVAQPKPGRKRPGALKRFLQSRD